MARGNHSIALHKQSNKDSRWNVITKVISFLVVMGRSKHHRRKSRDRSDDERHRRRSSSTDESSSSTDEGKSMEQIERGREDIREEKR